MAKTIFYVKKYSVRFKNWVCLRKRNEIPTVLFERKRNEISTILVQCSLKCGVTFFFVGDAFQGTFVDFRFMMLSLDERISTYLDPCP